MTSVVIVAFTVVVVQWHGHGGTMHRQGGFQRVQCHVGCDALAEVHIKQVIVADDAFQSVQLIFVLDLVLATLARPNVGGVGCWEHRRVGHRFDEKEPAIHDGGPLARQFSVR